MTKKAWFIAPLLVALVLGYGFTGEDENPFAPESPEAISTIFHSAMEKIRIVARITPQERAERYAELGESALEVPKAYHLAIEAFDLALRVDPTNPKANFYHGILKPFLHLQGIAMRTSRLLTPDAMSDLTFDVVNQEEDPELQKIFSKHLHDAGSRPIFNTMGEFQTFLTAELLPILEESKRKMDIVLRDPTIKIKFVMSRWGDPRLWSGHRGFVVFDSIDARSVKQICEGLIFAIKVISAYDLDALISLRDEFFNKEGITTKEVIEAVKKHPKFLTLKPGAAPALKEVLRDALPAIQGLRIVGKMIKDDSERSEKLFASFKTIDDYQGFLDGLSKALDIIAGPFEVRIERNKSGNPTPKKIIVNGTVLLSKPIEDLKALLPREFGKNGDRPKSFPDQTFGGIVPNGDLLSSLCALPKEFRAIEGLCEDEEDE